MKGSILASHLSDGACVSLHRVFHSHKKVGLRNLFMSWGRYGGHASLRWRLENESEKDRGARKTIKLDRCQTQNDVLAVVIQVYVLQYVSLD